MTGGDLSLSDISGYQKNFHHVFSSLKLIYEMQQEEEMLASLGPWCSQMFHWESALQLPLTGQSSELSE